MLKASDLPEKGQGISTRLSHSRLIRLDKLNEICSAFNKIRRI
jgi:hypothetical protein